MSEKITIEKEVWESTLKASMDRAGRIEILEQQLAIAVEALERYADLYNWEDSDDYYACTYKYDFANKEAQEALQQIKELNK